LVGGLALVGAGDADAAEDDGEDRQDDANEAAPEQDDADDAGDHAGDAEAVLGLRRRSGVGRRHLRRPVAGSLLGRRVSGLLRLRAAVASALRAGGLGSGLVAVRVVLEPALTGLV